MFDLMKKRRAAWTAALVIFALGLWVTAVLFISVFKDISSLDKSFVRLLAPGEKIVILAQAGPHTVYFENKGEIDGRIYIASEGAIAGLTLRIEDADTGEEIPVRMAKSKSTYSLGSREGASIMEFFAPKAGAYHFDAKIPRRGDAAEPFILAIGSGMMKGIFSVIAKIFGLVLILIATIAVPTVLIVTSSAGKLSAGKPQQQ